MQLQSVKSGNPRPGGGQVCKSAVQTSYDIVKAHGGGLKVDAGTEEGQSSDKVGSEFTIHLLKT